ncbi:Ig domain-containing protein [Ramlibacter tataouinensis]|uniref:Uncharacterized protein n=1 Tax=Ramlibacter tataouinensis (strain ATCC BAA-407 / DSM 14655 / LMG 21543 / TTB310) TaxID=365046 RepID=F5Y2Q0_RAMTT|nr:Ig domain-containing protein [Ramlibacter tataouinensis]AEG92413.1 hypothetical protein Rta_13260 [Ramlibacter tataouinensis TTB310]
MGARAHRLLGIGFALLLAACGGGGGGDSGDGGVLTVSLSYSGHALLLRQSTIAPTITGLRGRAPDCSLKSGALPPGLMLNRDCSITGTPLAAGSFPIVVNLGASGVANELGWSVSALVLGPSVTYSLPASMMTGASYDFTTLNNFWIATAADTVTYSVSEGSLPSGLVIDPGTGRITGTPAVEGDYSFKVTAQVVNAGRIATATSRWPESVTVNRPVIPYSQAQAWAGLPFRSTPTLPSGSVAYTFSATSLPAGLSIDPATGVISGMPLEPAFSADYRIELVGTTAGGGTFANFTNVSIDVESPVYIRYAGTVGRVDSPMSDMPVIVNNSGVQLTGISYSYALDDPSSLPLGLSLDPITGEISGTPRVVSGRPVRINVTVTINGISFVVPVDTVVSVQI